VTRLRLRAPSATAEAEPERDRALGRYRIRGAIGQGGMGVVYEGNDVDLGRDVALKVLRDRHLDKPEFVRRFVEEARIGGQLQHPGIVPVYELGLQAGRRPLFTMKLISGTTLAEVLAARADSFDDRLRMLKVFERVCHTVAYAHSRRVVHRDLKPSNIMIGSFGEVQVVDWGLAKVLAAEESVEQEADAAALRPMGRGGHSQAGSVMGTLAYMPPEQAQGRTAELDERSDIFALGAILCEILTGTPPYAADGEECLAQAMAGDTEDALGRLDGCRADEALVSLCRACLAPIPADRPRHGGLVAESVASHLSAVEERAHRSQLREIEQRSAAAAARTKAEEARAAAANQRRRRRQTVALAATILVAMVVFGAGWMWVESGRKERARRTALALGEAMREANRMGGSGEWAAALTAAGRARDLAETGEADREMRAQALALFREIERQERGARDAAARTAERAALRVRLRGIRMRAGEGLSVEATETDADYRSVLSGLGADLERVRDRRWPPELSGAVLDWIRQTGSKSVADGACAVAPEWAGLPAPEILARLRQDSDRADLSAQQLAERGVLAAALGDRVLAIELLREAWQRRPGDFWFNVHLGDLLLGLVPPRAEESTRHFRAARAARPGFACVWHRLGLALRASGEREEALAVLRRAVQLDPAHAAHHADLGAALEESDDLSEAIAAYRKAIEIRPGVASIHRRLGVALQKDGDAEGATAAWGTAIQLEPDWADAHLGLGNALLQHGDPAGAIEAYQSAIDRDPAGALARSNRGVALVDLGRIEDAEVAFREAIEKEPDCAEAHYNLGLVLRRRADADAAAASVRKALEIGRHRIKAHSATGAALVDRGGLAGALEVLSEAARREPNSAQARFHLGKTLRLQRRLEESIRELRKAVELDPTHADAWSWLGVALIWSGDHDGAMSCFRRVVELDPNHASGHDNLGLALANRGDLTNGLAHLRQAVDLDPNYANAHVNLGLLLLRSGNPEGAVAALRRAMELDPDLPGAYHLLGVIQRQVLRDVDGMLEAFRAAVRLRPRNAHYLTNLGIALYEDGDLKGAVAAYRKAIELNPNLANAHNNLGAVYCDDFRDFDGAVAEFEASLRIGPERATTHRNLGHARKGQGDFAGAAAAYRRAIELDPRLADAHNSLGVLLLDHLGDPRGALAELRVATSLAPQDAMYRTNLAYALQQGGDEPGAITALRKAVESDRDYAPALERLAWLLVTSRDQRLRDPAEAVALAARAQDRAPGVTRLRTLGAAQYRAGRLADAIHSLKLACYLHDEGGTPRIGFFLAMAYQESGREDEARQWRAKALAWMEAEPHHDVELERLRAEAEALLGAAGG
jgi:serine/threonine-protein kinase